MVPVRLTKLHVERLRAPTKAQRFLRDTELKGFILRVTPGGAKSFCLEKRIKGRSVRKTIGRYPDMSVEKARRQAHIWLGLLAEGKNPFKEDDDRAREKLTLRYVFKEYLDARKTLKPKTIEEYQQMIDRAFRDWHNRSLTEITKAMVQQRHLWLGRRNGPHYANNALRLLRAIYNFAAAAYDDAAGNPLIPVNPVVVLTQTRAWYPKKRRRTVITRAQLPAWYKAVLNLRKQLKNRKNPEKGLDPEAALVSDYLLLLLFTGLRRNEGASLRFDNIDFVDRTMMIPDTKNCEPLTLPLSDFLFDLLEHRLKETAGTFVFPGGGKRGHLIEPKRHVQRVIEQSGVPFMLHDLRRTFITVAESLDLSYYAIKRLVNHKISGDVTAGYVVTNVSRLREPMQRITNRLLAIAEVEEHVVAFPNAAAAQT
ncbi:MAG: integrase family protein [Planctomycetes bacterium]|nr:integrase family protein [Planctomycetota bacterium]